MAEPAGGDPIVGGGDWIMPRMHMHVNKASVSVLSTDGETTVLEDPFGLPDLAAGATIFVEGFGNFTDPDANGPNVVFTLKLDGTSVCTQSKSIGSGAFHFKAQITIRADGEDGTVAAAMAVSLDSVAEVFSFSTSVTVMDIIGIVEVDLTAQIDNYTGAEQVTFDLLTFLAARP